MVEGLELPFHSSTPGVLGSPPSSFSLWCPVEGCAALRVTDDDDDVVLSRSYYIYIVNKSIWNQLNNKDFSSLKCVNISHTCSSS